MPSSSATGQDPPKGPRPARMRPGLAEQSASVARPTARTVCTSSSGSSGSPLIEIGTSPAPPAEIIMNWPGSNGTGRPSQDFSDSVQVSRVSWRVESTSNGSGIIDAGSSGSGTIDAGLDCSDTNLPVHVQELHPRGLQPVNDIGGEPLHQLVAELVILLDLAAQAGTVERDQVA